jgi:hypothetical protein
LQNNAFSHKSQRRHSKVISIKTCGILGQSVVRCTNIRTLFDSRHIPGFIKTVFPHGFSCPGTHLRRAR